MRLVSLSRGGVGVVQGEEVLDVTGSLGAMIGGPISMLSLIGHVATAGLGSIEQLLGSAPCTPLGATGLDAPVPLPGAVVAAPVNYVDHRVEMSEARDIRSLGLFLKARSSVVGPGATVQLPYSDRRFDHEGELGVIIGNIAADVREDDALDHVFGYTCLLDITMRGGEDRSTRKSFPGFTPTGPWIVTADEIGDPGDLRLTCSVNGTVRQDARTSDLIWPVERLVAYASSVMTLYPGDILASGTPAGVGPIVSGDTVTVSIERLGILEVDVSSAGADLCPTLGASSGPVPPPPPAR